MTPVRPQPEVGLLLRRWRGRGRGTQIELALDAPADRKIAEMLRE